MSDEPPPPRATLTDPTELLNWVDRQEDTLVVSLGSHLDKEDLEKVRDAFERQRTLLSELSMFTTGYKDLTRRVAIETRERQEFETDLRAVTHTLSLERTQLEARISSRTRDLQLQNVRLEEEVQLRERAERELRLANRRMRWALDTARGGFWAYDVQNGEYQLSEDLARFLGLAPEEANFEAWFRQIHPEDRTNHNLEPLVAGRVERLVSHYRLRHPERGEILVQDNKNTLFEDGELRAIHGFVFDVSSADVAQQELMRRGTELERVSYDADRLARLATHDLQEPLRQILIFASMMDPGPETRDYERLRVLEATAQKMQSKLMRMRDYVTLGQTGLRFEEVHLDALVDAAEALVRSRMPEIEFDLIRAPDIVLFADTQLLILLLSQLLENAVLDRHPTRPLKVTIRTEAAQTFHRIEIRDNGIGVPPQHWDSVFQPIFRLPSEAEPGVRMGLGLAIARRIAQLHHGWIHIGWSEVEAGTAMVLQVPVKREARAFAGLPEGD